jgi:hypothetical protein
MSDQTQFRNNLIEQQQRIGAIIAVLSGFPGWFINQIHPAPLANGGWGYVINAGKYETIASPMVTLYSAMTVEEVRERIILAINSYDSIRAGIVKGYEECPNHDYQKFTSMALEPEMGCIHCGHRIASTDTNQELLPEA